MDPKDVRSFRVRHGHEFDVPCYDATHCNILELQNALEGSAINEPNTVEVRDDLL